MNDKERELLKFARTYGSKSVGHFIPFSLIEVFKWTEAAILCHLVDLYAQNKGKPFLCSIKELEAACFIDKYAQSKMFTYFVKLGILKTHKTKTIPASRVITLFPKKLYEIVDEFEGRLRNTKGARKCLQIIDSAKSLGIELPNVASLELPNVTTLDSPSLYNSSFHSELLKKDNVANSKPTDSIKPEHMENATKLLKALSSKGKITKSYSIKSWAKEIQKIELLDCVPAGLVQEVLNWYTRNLEEPYLPKAYSGKSFREKFARIKEKYEKVKTIPVDEKLLSVIKTVETTLPWKSDVRDDISSCCQLLFDRYLLFFQKIEKIDRRVSKNAEKPAFDLQGVKVKEFRKFIAVLNAKTPVGSRFVLDYMKRVSKKLANWQNWNGSLRSMIWNGNVENSTFQSMIFNYLGNITEEQKTIWTILKGIYDDVN